MLELSLVLKSLVIIVHMMCLDNYLIMGMLAFFHLLFLMLLWAFFQSMTTDPGQVPVFWGFHLGDAENKRRRYCLMCNVFKPERCHHCSACNRCVLNMDHHCPWINNCIGFWNRKYFLLRRYNYVLRLLVDREVGSGRILLLKYCERQTDIIPLSVNLDELHSYLHRCRAYDFLLKVSRIPCNNKQDDN